MVAVDLKRDTASTARPPATKGNECKSSVLRASGFQLAFDEMKFAGRKTNRNCGLRFSVAARSFGVEAEADQARKRQVRSERAILRGKPSAWSDRSMSAASVADSARTLDARPENARALFAGEKTEAAKFQYQPVLVNELWPARICTSLSCAGPFRQ